MYTNAPHWLENIITLLICPQLISGRTIEQLSHLNI